MRCVAIRTQILLRVYTKQMDENQWKEKLNEEQYHVLREKGTELPFTGEYWDTKDKGMYACAGCGAELFDSKVKFDSGTGWPSFAEAREGAIQYEKDTTLGMERTEAVCAKCGGHLGHVFEDGPETVGGEPASGKRYCINSCALNFKEE